MSNDIVLLPHRARVALTSTCAVLGLAVSIPAQATILAAPLALASIGVADSNCSQAQTFAPAASRIQPDQPGMSKSAAILGGTMSALERIRAEQAGLQTPQPALALPAAAPAAVFDVARPVNCSTAALAVPAASRPIASLPTSEEPAPDSFLATGRVAITRTSFSGNWDRVSADSLSRDRVTALIGDHDTDGASRVQFVNRWVNRSITYGEDRAIWGRRDYWATADQTLARRRGDCEDLAILKYHMLSALGVDPQDMYLTLARDLARNADHAVLIVRQGNHFFLLDNSTDAILPANLSYDYRPTLSFNSQSAWLHGAVTRSRPQVAAVVAQAPAPQLPLLTGQGYRPVQANIALLDYRPVLTDLVNRPQLAGQGLRPVQTNIALLEYRPGPTDLVDQPQVAAISVPDYLSVRARSSPRVIGFSR